MFLPRRVNRRLLDPTYSPPGNVEDGRNHPCEEIVRRLAYRAAWCPTQNHSDSIHTISRRHLSAPAELSSAGTAPHAAYLVQNLQEDPEPDILPSVAARKSPVQASTQASNDFPTRPDRFQRRSSPGSSPVRRPALRSA